MAGAVGPTGIKFSLASDSERTMGRQALAEQIAMLRQAGVDLIILETFASILEMETALAAWKVAAPELPVVAQMVFDQSGRLEGVLEPVEVARRLVAAGAHAVGGNCGVGPQELYEVGSNMVAAGVPVVDPAQRRPAQHRRRSHHLRRQPRALRRVCPPDVEVGGQAGRRLLRHHPRAHPGHAGGGSHDRRGRAAAQPAAPHRGRRPGGPGRRTGGPGGPGRMPAPAPAARVPLAQRSRLGARLAAGEFAVSVELTAPTGTDPGGVLERVTALTHKGVDVINIADGPRATARMGNLAFCTLAHQQTGVEPILHVCCRDRNYLGLVAHLLGAHALGLRNLVIITGDPPKMGDYPFATPVYDVDSVGLIEIAAGLNAGVDPGGKELGGHTSFLLATGAEPGAVDHERELRRVEDKRAAGAELIMTQPVYDPETLDRFLDDVTPMGLPVMVGLLPLASHRNAEFLHNEVPGMQIPAHYRERMAKVGSGPDARAEGVHIAQEALAAVADRVAGAYIMPPFNRVEAAVKVLEVVGHRWRPAPPPEPEPAAEPPAP